MNGESDLATGSWSVAAWRRTPFVVALIAVVTFGLVFTVFDASARPWVIGPTILLLDLGGAVYSWRAAGHSPPGTSTTWRLIAAGRFASLCTTLSLSGLAMGGDTSWWWTGTLARLLMYVLLAAGVLISGVRQFTGRSRAALLAEITTVLAAGFMLIWYFALEPVVAHQRLTFLWIATVGWPLGDVLLVAAVASVVLRGAVNRFSAPVTVFAAGLAVYLCADVIRAAIGATSARAETDPAALSTLVAASLLMTVAPMLIVARAGRPYAMRTSRPPAWATQLPLFAMLVGGVLMLAVTILERQLLHWGALVCGLIVMSGAAAVRQMVSVRESRERIISDPLTGLTNRAGLDEALDRAVKRAEPVAVLLLDLDGFKLVNDAYGHAAGDAFLVHVGRQLRAAVRNGNVCARIGGDEFAILLTDITRPEQAIAVAERILAVTTAHPVDIEDDSIPVRASIGVAVAGLGYDGKTLLRQADLAMYHSKRAGSHGYTCYEPSMVDHRTADAALSDDLEHALHRGEFHVLYQPLVDLATGRPIAAEALLRWSHPTRGLVSPAEFIPVAERSGAITGIGLWVLEQALVQLAAMPVPESGEAPPYVSVNLSPRQLGEPTIVHDILAVLDRVGADPRRLVLEVTESALVDESSGIAALRVLRGHGIRIAIDDFGTGYSSLHYLTRLPVDILKVDRSFVAELNGTPEGAAVTEAVVRLAQVLHLSTVAEGIETEEQAAELRALGCVTGQGYLFAKPLTPQAFAQYAATGALRSAAPESIGRL
jgi:diguanylate cyclase (GGDEF)-like protein